MGFIFIFGAFDASFFCSCTLEEKDKNCSLCPVTGVNFELLLFPLLLLILFFVFELLFFNASSTFFEHISFISFLNSSGKFFIIWFNKLSSFYIFCKNSFCELICESKSFLIFFSLDILSSNSLFIFS